VVVRYFGGTKLGVGPLGKAYGEAANNLLETSSIIKLTKFEKISFTYDYEYVSSIHYLLGKYKCEDITNMFDTSPGIECCIEPRKIDQLRAEMIEKTAGKVNIIELNQQIYKRINQSKN
jgi:putative IMPACT (imprinted ancient) family translation regulator